MEATIQRASADATVATGMPRGSSRGSVVLALLIPPAVLASMWLVFAGLTRAVGAKAGYFLAFAVYWLGWCLLVPMAMLGRKRLLALFGSGTRPLAALGWHARALLVLPPLAALITVFPPGLPRTTLLVALGSLGLAAVNGTLEEVLWRGVYARLFPDSLTLGYLYPALGFALWHLAPQAVHPFAGPGAVAAFVGGALAVGLCYGWIAWRTGSIRATAISHIIFDFLGLGALMFFG
jgi:CAAX protease family protein